MLQSNMLYLFTDNLLQPCNNVINMFDETKLLYKMKSLDFDTTPTVLEFIALKCNARLVFMH